MYKDFLKGHAIENKEDDRNSLDGKDWIQQRHVSHESEHDERRASVDRKVRKVSRCASLACLYADW